MKTNRVIQKLIISLIADNYQFSLRPVPFWWQEAIFLTLWIHDEKKRVILDFLIKGTILIVNYHEKFNGGFLGIVNPGTFVEDLLEPDSILKLREFLDVICKDKCVIIEYDNKNEEDINIAKVFSHEENCL